MAFTVLNSTLALASQAQKQKTESLLNIIEENNWSIVLAFGLLDEQNISVPEAQKAYDEGLAHVKEATSLVDQEKFSEASSESIDVMQKFEESLRLLEIVFPEDTPVVTTAKVAVSLRVNITRVVTYVERLENLTTVATSAGYNTLVIQKRLEEIKLHLRTATQKLRTLNMVGATEELSIAETLLEELKENLTRLTNLVTERNTERYLLEAEIRVSAAKSNITLSSTLTPEAKENAIIALNNSEVSLTNARDLIECNNVDDAIGELEKAKRWEDKSVNATSMVTASTAVLTKDGNLAKSESIGSS